MEQTVLLRTKIPGYLLDYKERFNEGLSVFFTEYLHHGYTPLVIRNDPLKWLRLTIPVSHVAQWETLLSEIELPPTRLSVQILARIHKISVRETDLDQEDAD